MRRVDSVPARPREAKGVEMGMYEPEPAARYEIRVKGVLDSRWSTWFEGLQISSDEPGETLIAGPIIDQAALHGVLGKIRDLALPLISVRRIDASL
jgi:hypothetical protein